MTDARVSGLFIHPLKSAARIAVTELRLDERGAVNDRRWMLVDADGVAITQREAPRLALIVPEVIGDTLLLCAPAGDVLRIAPDMLSPTGRRAIIWDDEVEVRDAGDLASMWCSNATGISCRLVRLADESPRALNPKYAGPVDAHLRRVALSDGAPLLLLGEGSLSALNARLADKGDGPLGVDRFRTNVLLAGTSPHEEDTWSAITIGEVDLGVGTPCPRCVVTTTNQQTAERGVEPLRMLATYRKQPGGAMFGVNATHARPGVIRLGDRVAVHSRKGVTASA